MNRLHPSLILAALLSLGLFSLSAAAQEGDAAAGDHVARAVFTTGIDGREPTDTVTTFGNDKNRIYFFTELRGLGGHTVTHRWQYQDKTMAEVDFAVGGPRWRVWSSKTLLPQWTGEWRVEVVDEGGTTLGQAAFTYTEAGSD